MTGNAWELSLDALKKFKVRGGKLYHLNNKLAGSLRNNKHRFVMIDYTYYRADDIVYRILKERRR